MSLVLIFSNLIEPGVNRVVNELEKSKKRFLRINSDNLFEANNFQTQMFLANSKKKTYVTYKDQCLDIEDVTSIWHRKLVLPRAKNEREISDINSFIADEWESTIWSLCTTSTSYWINQPLWGGRLLEHNKLYQMEIAKRAGLNIPNTIVTNSYETILKFCDEHNGVIACKVMRTRLFQNEAKTFGIYTQKILREDIIGRRHNIEKCPIMAQEYIEKQVELRITIIGHHIFTCAIYSQDSPKTVNDWRRYDLENVRHEIFKLPKDIQAQLLHFMTMCNLNFGAIDMIITPSGKYYFLEVNPSGQFGWIESLTGMPIAKTIAESLCQPKENGLKIFNL